ncbi:MAG: nicotinate (nicotinamide) nucleotide adenylyltransferase [Ignavibacteria bacterium]|nr:MAG: nicotinate (nicotinamide) nucleotide adenylyltransferase [Ignavibacteria bacterium]KAF0159922.1 MAG: nicotinate (nicotinamide) nucleotide adenylyltransferase [Ignavibacteria bacterium]
MAIGLYGGTFDPIHFGHLITTQFVLEQRNLDKIIFMPSHISPLKQDSTPIQDIHRLEMVRLATESNSNFFVSDYEIAKGNISYTYETLCELKKSYDAVELIIGLDNLLVFEKWFYPNKIFDMAKVVVMKRFTENIDTATNIYFDKAIFIDTPYIEISSTEIRERIKNDLTIDYLVPQKVKEYIFNNRLYLPAKEWRKNKTSK